MWSARVLLIIFDNIFIHHISEGMDIYQPGKRRVSHVENVFNFDKTKIKPIYLNTANYLALRAGPDPRRQSPRSTEGSI